MKIKGVKIHVVVVTALVFALMTTIATSYVQYQNGLHRIAVNKSLVESTAIEKTVTATELYNIYSGSQPRWGDGRQVIAFTYPPQSSAGRIFAIQNLGITPSKFDRLIENNDDTLNVVRDEIQMYYSLVKEDRGIGYFYSDSFIDNPRLTRVHVTDNRFSCCRRRSE